MASDHQHLLIRHLGLLKRDHHKQHDTEERHDQCEDSISVQYCLNVHERLQQTCHAETVDPISESSCHLEGVDLGRTSDIPTHALAEYDCNCQRQHP